MAGRTNMKDKKLEEAIDYVCSRCPYIFSDSTEWDKSNPAFADWRDSATKFGKRGLVLQHGEDDVSSFTLNPSWLSCEDETQRCIMVEIYLEP